MKHSESEPVSPNQIILLKLLDSYLESTEVDVDGCGKRELASTLSAAFCQLSTWACEAIRGALGLASPPSSKETQGAADWEVVNAADGSERGQEVRGDGETNRVDAAENDDKGKGRASTDTVGPLREIDPLLPKACEALVLVTQCTVSIALDARPSDARRHEHERGRQLRDDESGWVTEDDQENEVTGLEVRSMVNDAVAPNGQGLIECLIGSFPCCIPFAWRLIRGLIFALGTTRTAPLGGSLPASHQLWQAGARPWTAVARHNEPDGGCQRS
jgi:hypothetical protein